MEWEEEPFEWTFPYSYGVVRRYSKGPIDEMRAQVNFTPLPEGGTRLRYQTWMITSNLLAQAGIPFAIQSGYESYVPKTRVVLWEAALAAARMGCSTLLLNLNLDAVAQMSKPLAS